MGQDGEAMFFQESGEVCLVYMGTLKKRFSSAISREKAALE
jgi:hypothetical protein